MSARLVPFEDDPARPERPRPLQITFDGEAMSGVLGQTLASVILASGRLNWRVTSVGSKPRGVFCGIGVCFDCIVEVNNERDVRSCLRRACDGDVVATQHDPLPLPFTDGEAIG